MATDSPSSSCPSLLSSLTAKPTKALVPPGQCQFHDEFQAVPLLDRTWVSPTSSILRFGLPDPFKPLNLSTCACILARAKVMTKTTTTQHHDDNDNGNVNDKNQCEEVIRPYTPISTNAMKGSFDLLVKHYGEEAKMSKHLHTIKVGDTVEFKHIDFNVKLQAPFAAKHIVMLVGGTGITPMIQALHAILGSHGDHHDNTEQKVTMLYGSKVAEDILGRDMVDAWAKEYPSQFQVHHILSHEPSDSAWEGLRGYMDKAKLSQYLPSPNVGSDLLIFVCGPPPMYDALCGPRDVKEVTGLLADLGYSKDQVYKF